jgi:N-methylhydantoinase B
LRRTRACRSRTGAILNGQLNALDLGERRLNALLDEYGDETITAALAALSARAEALMRANILGLPDGTYRCDDFLDNDGVTDQPLKIALDLTIAGDRMTLDFSRSAPPCDGPLNIARSTTVACCYVALKHLFTDVPANAGCLAPIEFVIPGHDAARRLGTAPGRRLHRDDPARDRHDLRRVRQSRAGARQRQPVRHHQRALASGWREHGPALGDVLLLRRRARRQPGGRRAQPRQQPDLDRDHPPLEILESLYP